MCVFLLNDCFRCFNYYSDERCAFCDFREKRDKIERNMRQVKIQEKLQFSNKNKFLFKKKSSYVSRLFRILLIFVIFISTLCVNFAAFIATTSGFELIEGIYKTIGNIIIKCKHIRELGSFEDSKVKKNFHPIKSVGAGHAVAHNSTRII